MELSHGFSVLSSAPPRLPLPLTNKPIFTISILPISGRVQQTIERFGIGISDDSTLTSMPPLFLVFVKLLPFNRSQQELKVEIVKLPSNVASISMPSILKTLTLASKDPRLIPTPLG